MTEAQQIPEANRYTECLDLRSAEGNPIRFIVDLRDPRWARAGTAAYDRRFPDAGQRHGAFLDRISPTAIHFSETVYNLGPWTQEDRPNPWVLTQRAADILRQWWSDLIVWHDRITPPAQAKKGLAP